MFEDKYRQANDTIRPSHEADERVLNAMSGSVTTRSGRSGAKKWLTAAVAAVMSLMLIVPAAVGISKLSRGNSAPEASDPIAEDGRSVLALNVQADDISVNADDYSKVFEVMKPSLSAFSSFDGSVGDFFRLLIGGSIKYTTESAASSLSDMKNAAPAADRDTAVQNGEPIAPESSDGRNEDSVDYSHTNTQVEGVDEADVIKTDGRYIYVLNNEGVSVLSADGEDSEKLSFIAVEDMPKHHENSSSWFVDMYLINGKLIVIANENVIDAALYDLPKSVTDDADDCYICGSYYMRYGSGITAVYVYDVSDPAEPRLINNLCMDGWYNTSRLTGGRLYMVTDYSPRSLIYENAPCTYVPCTYDGNGTCKLTPAKDINILVEDGESCSSYVYVSSLDVDSPEDFIGTLAIMGYSQTEYCSADNLYITMSDYEYEQTEINFDIDPQTGDTVISENGSKQGTLVSDYTLTKIFRISISGPKPVLEAEGSVKGYLLNQFSMDEYNGFLRVVTDMSEYSYIQQISKETGSGYCFDIVDSSSNALYVLDPSLNVVGSIEDIGRDEHVKSVRFMGDIGYVVTFRQTDPLFSIDLKNPAAPVILGELKIPGFSEYMHPWGSDKLFGLGQMADEVSGGVEGLKLTMFDISDKTDVKVLFGSKVKDVYYSAAEYDHKAILVSKDRGIIGFPGDSGSYYIYTYDDNEGFKLKSMVDLGDGPDYGGWYGSDLRGMYIGNCFYIIERYTGVMYVIDLTAFELTGTVAFN